MQLTHEELRSFKATSRRDLIAMYVGVLQGANMGFRQLSRLARGMAQHPPPEATREMVDAFTTMAELFADESPEGIVRSHLHETVAEWYEHEIIPKLLLGEATP